MDEEILEKYKKAGQIAKECLLYGRDLIKKDTRLLDVTEKIERKIDELGAKPAFPVQISPNDIAAHYCAFEADKTVFDDQIVCLDVGVHIDGFIGDNACSVDLSGNNSDLIKASQEALKSATETLEIGVKLSKIGGAIETTISNLGFQPVRNLSGHGLGQYEVHTKPTVPNYDTGSDEVLQEGYIACEPFASSGVGLIEEKGEANVFSIEGKKSVRTGFVRDIQKEIEGFSNMPFTKRWIKKSPAQISYAFKTFKQLGILKEYPPLVERSGGLVSQAENSFYIGDEVVLLTK